MNARSIALGLIWAAWAAGFTQAAEAHDGRAAAKDATAPRSLSAIHADVRDALRAEATSRRQGPNSAEVMRVVELYREMAAHPRRDDSPLLRQLGLQVRSRLKNVCERAQRQIAQRNRRTTNEGQLPALAAPKTTVLAQQFGAAGAGLQGGQAAAAPPAAAGGMDYGPELVGLIQQTISPGTWDVNGGIGAVVYFAPRQVIVVSAPAAVHDEVSHVLGQLRAAP